MARSLRTGHGIPLAHGLAQWEHYNRSAAVGPNGIDTYIIDSASVIEDSHWALADVDAWLVGLERFAPLTVRSDTEAAVNSGLRHVSARQKPDAHTLPGVIDSPTSATGPAARSCSVQVEGVFGEPPPPDLAACWFL